MELNRPRTVEPLSATKRVEIAVAQQELCVVKGVSFVRFEQVLLIRNLSRFRALRLFGY